VVFPRREVFAFDGAWAGVESGIARGLRRRQLVEIVVGSVRGGRPRGLVVREGKMSLLLDVRVCLGKCELVFSSRLLLSKAVARKAVREGLVALSSSDQSIG
jgi:hypothetical protein